MKPIVIFGAGAFAEILHFYFSHDTGRKVVAFTVDASHLKATSFCGLPVVPYDTLAESFPPAQYDMCIAIGYPQKGHFGTITDIRIQKYLDAIGKGYELVSYISSKANVWHPHLIGKNTIIMEGNTLQPFVTIGNNVTLFTGNNFGHHAIVKDHVFISGNSAIAGQTIIGEGSFIGIGAILRNGVQLGQRCFIGVGAIVTANVRDESVYTAKPASLRRIKSAKILA